MPPIPPATPETQAEPTPAPASGGLGEMIDEYIRQAPDAILDRPLNQSGDAAEPPAPKPQKPDSANLQTPAPKPSRHPSILRTQAINLGMTPEEIEASSAADLNEYVNTLSSLGRDRDWSSGNAERTKPGGEEGKTTPAEPNADSGLDWSGVDEALIDTEIQAAINSAVAPLVARIKELEGGVGNLTKFEQKRQAETQYSRIDGLFAELGRPEVYGKGGRDDLDPQGNEMTRRQTLIDGAAKRLAGKGDWAGFKAAVKALDAALYGPTGNAEPEPAPAKRADVPRGENGQFLPRPEVQAWAESTTQRPTNRQPGPEPKGENRAARAIADVAARSGHTLNGNARLEDFPD